LGAILPAAELRDALASASCGEPSNEAYAERRAI
jgi:hypothetical protein